VEDVAHLSFEGLCAQQVFTVGLVDDDDIGKLDNTFLIPCSSSPAPAIMSRMKQSTIE